MAEKECSEAIKLLDKMVHSVGRLMVVQKNLEIQPGNLVFRHDAKIYLDQLFDNAHAYYKEMYAAQRRYDSE